MSSGRASRPPLPLRLDLVDIDSALVAMGYVRQPIRSSRRRDGVPVYRVVWRLPGTGYSFTARLMQPHPWML